MDPVDRANREPREEGSAGEPEQQAWHGRPPSVDRTNRLTSDVLAPSASRIENSRERCATRQEYTQYSPPAASSAEANARVPN